jgi:hypothetical protein
MNHDFIERHWWTIIFVVDFISVDNDVSEGRNCCENRLFFFDEVDSGAALSCQGLFAVLIEIWRS